MTKLARKDLEQVENRLRERQRGLLEEVRNELDDRENQHLAAVNDFTKALAIDPYITETYLLRARSYEEMNDFEKAGNDYTRVVAMNESGSAAKKLLTEANDRLFAINREYNSPEIFIETPDIAEGGNIELGYDRKSLMVTGKVSDKSLLAEFTINSHPVKFEGKGTIPFAAEVEIPSDETLRIVARDVYNNLVRVDADLAEKLRKLLR